MIAKYARALLMLLALVMSATAMATPGSRIDDGFPPIKYQHDTVAVVYFVDHAALETACGVKAPPGYTLEGCAVGQQIAMPNPCSAEFAGEYYAKIMCHEMGHTNGWPGNHPAQ